MKFIRSMLVFLMLGFLFLAGSVKAEESRHQKCSTGQALAVIGSVTSSNLLKPTDILRFKDKLVATELNANRLAFCDDLSLKKVEHFDPRQVGQKFHAPHFLSLSPWGTLLISSGWGTSIVEITDLNGTGWNEFHGVEKFRAPHGVCIDDQGWIYVGDSLNSRLVRFRDMDGGGWQVFKDVDKVVAYARQMVWKDGALWVSNSYEQREGLNAGAGANVLKIEDFESGKAEIIYARQDTNFTGILPEPEHDRLLVGLWGGYQQVYEVDLKSGQGRPLRGTKRPGMGVPYGMFHDPVTGKRIVTYFGALTDKTDPGGLLILGEE